MKQKLYSIGMLLWCLGGLALYAKVMPGLVLISIVCLIPPYILAWKFKTGVFKPWGKCKAAEK